MNRRFALLYLLLALAALGYVGQMDYEDALTQHDAYCKNVAEGVWPDYKEIFEDHCKDFDEIVVDKEQTIE